MKDLVRVTLDNEMDLILAHRNAMKLADLVGLTLSAQTTFATAVSEVSRFAIEGKRRGQLILGITKEGRENFIIASIREDGIEKSLLPDGLTYARRLVNRTENLIHDGQTIVNLYYYFFQPRPIDIQKLDAWRTIFRNQPALSPYDEIKRKNDQLSILASNLQISEGNYRTLTDTLPLILATVDLSGNIHFSNRWLRDFAGIADGQSLDMTFWTGLIHQDDISVFQEAMKDAPAHAPLHEEIRLSGRGGKFLWHKLTVSPFITGTADEGLYLLTLVDIHAQKSFQETLEENAELVQARVHLEENQLILQRTIDQLNQSNQELQQFAYVASHDLQEPVRKMLYYSSTILEGITDDVKPEHRQSLEKIAAAGQRMRNLIRDLLLYSQVGRQEPVIQTIHIKETLTEVLTDLELQVKDKAIVRFSGDPMLEADESMFRQLLQNLMSNALKFSQRGERPEIQIRCSSEDKWWRLEIQDNGIGFSPEDADKIFGLFTRLQPRTEFEGTGLGLAICRKLMDHHHGRISASSSAGMGATFECLFPKIQFVR